MTCPLCRKSNMFFRKAYGWKGDSLERIITRVWWECPSCLYKEDVAA